MKETLAAETSCIADDDGLDNATYTYQWVRNDGNSDTDIAGSADTTYTDDTVEPDKRYVYRIKAINEHGEVSERSHWVRANTPN